MNKFSFDLNPFTSDMNKFGSDLNQFTSDMNKFGFDLNPFTLDMNKISADLNPFTSDTDAFGFGRGTFCAHWARFCLKLRRFGATLNLVSPVWGLRGSGGGLLAACRNG